MNVAFLDRAATCRGIDDDEISLRVAGFIRQE